MLALCLPLCSCNIKKQAEGLKENIINVETKEQEKEEEKEVNDNLDLSTPDGVIAYIRNDFTNAAENAKKEYLTLKAEIDTYEKYRLYPGKVDEFYDKIMSTTDSLFRNSEDKYATFLKVSLEKCQTDKELERAFEDFYDAIYDEAFEGYYDEVYDRLFEDLYDDIYDDLFENAYDEANYGDWSNAHAEFYSKYVDAHASFFQKYVEAHGRFFKMYTNMRSAALYGGRREYSEIMDIIYRELESYSGNDSSKQVFEEESFSETRREEENKVEIPVAEEKPVEEKPSEPVTESNGIRPEFQKAMDEYIAFFEEYCSFIKKYNASDDIFSLLGEYASYMKQYSETMEAFNAVDEEELSKEEQILYLDTLNKINKMLLEAV